METRDFIFRVMLMIFVAVNVFFLNVVVHEAGHYIAAEYYELNGKIEFEFESLSELSFGFEGIPIAYTEFDRPEDDGELLIVGLMGPFVNLLLSLVFMFGFVFVKKVRNVFLVCFFVSILSFLMNIIPISGSDGEMIWGIL